MFTVRPYPPLNEPKALESDLWIIDGPVTRMRYLLWSLPFSTRATLVRLPGGELWMHSPVRWTPELGAKVDALGRLRHLVAPNKLHWEGLAGWKRAYPDARVLVAPGVEEKAAEGGFTVDEVLTTEPPPAWENALDMCVVPGTFMHEAVFLHRASGTVILTDLCENFERDHLVPGWTAPLMRWAGVLAPHGGTPKDLRVTFLSHKAEAKVAAERMITWAPRRIILSHGAVIEADASGTVVAELRRIFAWTGL